VQPHSEFVKRKRHGDPVRQGRHLGRPPVWPAEDGESTDRGKQEDAVIEVMDVGSAEEEIEIRHLVGHDQEHERPGDDEGQDEAEQGHPGQLMHVQLQHADKRGASRQTPGEGKADGQRALRDGIQGLPRPLGR
jgi:hypothetical protein